MKGNDTLPNMDFGEWARAQARPFMGKHEQAQAEHEQILGNFPILGVWNQISLILWRIYEGNWHTPKSGFWGVRTARARPFTGKHEQAEAEHEQILEFSDFGCFEPDITDFVKNL